MTGSELTFWDHVTLLGALGIVVGYIVFRIRIAMNPNKGGCSGCSGGGGCSTPAAPTSDCAPPSTVNLLNK